MKDTAQKNFSKRISREKYDAASAFTAMVNKTFNKSGAYKDFELMHQAINYDVKSNQANNNRSRQLHSKHSTLNENSDDDEPPPPCKRQNQVLNLLSLLLKMKVTMMMMGMRMIKCDKIENK